MSIQPVLIRRVSRVRDRMESTDPGDAILDDVIVLWRAFEATFDRSRSDEQNEMAAVALGETIRYHGIQKLPATRALIDRLKHLENASIGQVAEWFGSGQQQQTPGFGGQVLGAASKALLDAG